MNTFTTYRPAELTRNARARWNDNTKVNQYPRHAQRYGFPGLGKEKIVQRSLATHAQTILSVTQGKNDVHGPVGAGEFQAAGGSKILEVAGLVNMAH